jgi:hypothetical protein
MRKANQLLTGGASVLALGVLAGCGDASKPVARPSTHVSPTTQEIEDTAASIFGFAAEASIKTGYKSAPIGTAVRTIGGGELTLSVGYEGSKSSPSKVGAIILTQYASNNVAAYTVQIEADSAGGWDMQCDDPFVTSNHNDTLSETQQQSVFLADGYGIYDPSAAETALTSQLNFVRRAINSVRGHLRGSIAELPDPCMADYPPQS